MFILYSSSQVVVKKAEAGWLLWERRWRRMDRQMREDSLKSWGTAGLSSLWGQSWGSDRRGQSHQFPSLSSSPFSPLCGTSSSAVSPALTGWSPGSRRRAWSLLRWLFAHLEEIQAQIHNKIKGVTKCKTGLSHKRIVTDGPSLNKAIKPTQTLSTVALFRVCSNELISYWKIKLQNIEILQEFQNKYYMCVKQRSRLKEISNVFVLNPMNRISGSQLNIYCQISAIHTK